MKTRRLGNPTCASALALAAALTAAAAGTAADPAAPAAHADSLTVIAHASVKIRTAEGRVIYVDPASGSAAAYADSADMMLITHSHADHNQPSLVRRKATCTSITWREAVLSGVYQSFSAGGVTVDAVPAYNANHPKGTGVGYVIAFNGITLYHAGDTGKIPEMADLAARHIGYALLPMDGIYNMGPEAAVEAAALFGPAHVIPIHTAPGSYSQAIVDRFTGPGKIEVKPGETIALEPVASGTGRNRAGPGGFGLEQNYPNPFNPATVLPFSLDRDGRVALEIFDSAGRRVAVPVSGFLRAGSHRAAWNADGQRAGVYLARLRSGASVQTRKLLLVK